MRRWREVRTPFLFAVAAYVLIQIFSLGLGSTRKVMETSLAFQKDAGSKTLISAPFSLDGGSAPLNITAFTGMLPTGGYLALNGALVNADTQQTIPLSLPMTNHLGNSEEQTARIVLPAVPSGKYYFRFEPDAAPMVTQAPVQLSATRGGLFWSNFWLGFAALALWPLWTRLRAFSFEKQRWMESDFSPYVSSGDDGDSDFGDGGDD